MVGTDRPCAARAFQQPAVERQRVQAGVARQRPARGRARGHGAGIEFSRRLAQPHEQALELALDVLDVVAAHDDAVVRQQQHVGRRVRAQRVAHRSGQRQPGLAIGHPGVPQVAQQRCDRGRVVGAHQVRDRLDRVQVHHHALRHQRMQHRLDGRPQRGAIACAQHGRPRLRARLREIDRHEHRPRQRIGHAGARRLDPQHAVVLPRDVAAGVLHQHRIGARACAEVAYRVGQRALDDHAATAFAATIAPAIARASSSRASAKLVNEASGRWESVPSDTPLCSF